MSVAIGGLCGGAFWCAALVSLAPCTRIAATSSPPQEAQATLEKQRDKHLARFRERIERIPFFAELEYEFVATHYPLLFCVEKRDGDYRGGYAEHMAGRFAPLYRNAIERFETEYARPLGLSENPQHAGYRVVILENRKTYDRYLASIGTHPHSVEAHYEPLQTCLFLGGSISQDANIAAHERWAAVHELGHALLDAHAGGANYATSPTWFVEGAAEWTAAMVMSPPEKRHLEYMHLQKLEAFGDVRRSPSRWRIQYSPFEEFFAASSYEDILGAALRRAQGSGWAASDLELLVEQALPAFYLQAYLFVLFLNEGRGEDGRKAWSEHVHSLLALGPMRSPRLALARTADERAKLEREFLEWFDRRESERRSSGAHRSAYTPDEPISDEQHAAAVADALGAGCDPGLFEPGAEWEDAPELVLARALALARTNLFAEATASLDRALARADHERLARERARIAAWGAAVDDFLADWVADEARIPLGASDVPERLAKVRLDLVARDGNRLRFRGLRATDELELSLASVAPTRLRAWMEALDYGPGGSSAYPHALEGRWDEARELLGDAGGEAGELAADVQGDLPFLFELSKGVARLVAWHHASAPPPSSSDAPRDDAHDWFPAELVARVSPETRRALRAELARVYACLFGRNGFGRGLGATCKALPAGRFRLEYDFDSRAETRDFRGHEDEPAGVEVDSGKLVARPGARFEHVLELGAPFEISFAWRVCGEGHVRPQLAACVRQPDIGLAVALHVGELASPEGPTESTGERPAVYADEWYESKLVHDGRERVTLFHAGQRIASAPAAGLLRGGLRFDMAGSQAIELRSLSIEARIEPASLAALEAAWISGELERMGLSE